MEYFIVHKGLRGFENVSLQIDLTKITRATRNKSYPNLSNCCQVPLVQKKFCGNCGTEITDIKELKYKQFKLGKEAFAIPAKHLEQIRNQLDDNKIVITEYRDMNDIDSILYTDIVFSSKQYKKAKKEYNEFKELLKRTNKVGIGTMIYNHRPYPCMVYHYKDHIVIRLLHYESEIDTQPAIEQTPVNEQKLELLAKVMSINKPQDEFDISKFKNSREEAEEELIEMVIEGKELPKIQSVEVEQSTDDAEEIARLQALINESGGGDTAVATA